MGYRFGLAMAALFSGQAAVAADVTVVGSLTREATLSVGQTHGGTIVLRNNTDAPLDVLVYVRDYAFAAGGSNQFPPAGSLPRSNAPWLSFSPEQATIPADATTSVAWRVEVPGSDELVGTYWSVLLVEPMTDRFDPAQPDSDSMVTVNTIFRTAVQIITTVDGGAVDLGFAGTRLTADGGQTALAVDVGNIGDRWVQPVVWAELYDDRGSSLGRFTAGRRRLYPGTSARWFVDLSDVPAATYTALIVADDGSDNLFGTQLTLDLDGA